MRRAVVDRFATNRNQANTVSLRLHDSVVFNAADGVARITLAGEPGNAINIHLARGVFEAVVQSAALAARGAVRLVVIDARGPAFCVGGDLREFAGAATEVNTWGRSRRSCIRRSRRSAP